MSEWNFKDKLVVITGAGSGIGAALAQNLAQRGCHLALVDIDADGLEQTRAAIRQNVRISTHHMDIRDRAAVADLPENVQAAHTAPADMIVNNAGVALQGTFSEASEDDFDWLLDINLHAPIRLTRAFLPVLAQRPSAQIVNISSIFGIVGPPGQTAYATSKFGIRGFTEALRHELSGTQIGVVQVHPGGINTSIARNSRMSSQLTEEETEKRISATEAFLRMPPDRAAEIIAKGVEAGRARILIGNDARAMAFVQRLLPTSYWSVLKKLLGG